MTEFKLPGLSVKSTYVVQLEHIDPFGFREYSEPLIINADESNAVLLTYLHYFK